MKQRKKVKIGKYSGAWNYLSIKRQDVKSDALASKGPECWLKSTCWPLLEENVIY